MGGKLEVLPVVYRNEIGDFVRCRPEALNPDRILSGPPVREFAHYHDQRNAVGWYASRTMARPLAYESWLERTRLLLADFDVHVLGIAAQPFQLVWLFDGTLH